MMRIQIKTLEVRVKLEGCALCVTLQLLTSSVFSTQKPDFKIGEEYMSFKCKSPAKLQVITDACIVS